MCQLGKQFLFAELTANDIKNILVVVATTLLAALLVEKLLKTTSLINVR